MEAAARKRAKSKKAIFEANPEFWKTYHQNRQLGITKKRASAKRRSIV